MLAGRGDRRERASASSSRPSAILDRERTELRFNGEWLGKLDLRGGRPADADDAPSRGCSSATTSPSASRASEPISVSELLYPLMQAYDSVAVEADVELGGTDQLYNLLDGPRRDAGTTASSRRSCSRTPLLARDGRREKMIAVAGQLHRPRRAARGAVRQDDVDPGRGAARPVVARAGRPTRAAGRRPDGGEARARALHRHALRTARRRRGRPRPTSRASCASARRPRRCPRPQLPDGDPVHLPALLVVGVRHVDERGAAPDRPGRASRRRRDRLRARRPAGDASPALSSRPESAASPA